MSTLRFGLALLLGLAGSSALAQSPEGRLYAPGAFDRLDVDGSARITLTQGDKDQVFVAGDADVQKSVQVRLVGTRLEIQPSGGWKFWNDSRLEIDVQVRQLNQLALSGNSDVQAPGRFKGDQLVVSISGAGAVRFDRLELDRLKFSISGAGDGQLAGQVNDLSLNVSGKGKVLAEQLRAATATVSISGVGNARLWATEALRVSISGVGHVDYWGQPELKRSVSGLGSVNALGDKR
jgi:hypothetical protein